MKSMTCEQLYNIWSTDPHLIVILDARPAEEFGLCRIPGSLLIEKNGLSDKLAFGAEKLVVVVAIDRLQQADVDLLSTMHNVMFVKDCHRWRELELPLVGTSAPHRGRHFRIGTLGVYPLSDAIEPSFLIVDPTSAEACLIGSAQKDGSKELESLFGIRILYQIQFANGGLRLTCLENPEHFERVELEDGQVLLLGDNSIAAICGSPKRYFIQFEDKAIAMSPVDELEAEDWSRLRTVLPRGLLYGRDGHKNFSTHLIGIDHVQFSKEA